MARPVQPLGTIGKITVKRAKTGHVASTRFRELTGSYRRVTAKADTAKAAENALKERIAAGLASLTEGDLNGQSKPRSGRSARPGDARTCTPKPPGRLSPVDSPPPRIVRRSPG